MPDKLTDPELIEAVALKAGWVWFEFVHPVQGPVGERLLMKPVIVGRSELWRLAEMQLPTDKYDSISNCPPWPTSVDACLKLLDDMDYDISKRGDIYEVTLYLGDDKPKSWLNRRGHAVEDSECRAILLAWLEA